MPHSFSFPLLLIARFVSFTSIRPSAAIFQGPVPTPLFRPLTIVSTHSILHLTQAQLPTGTCTPFSANACPTSYSPCCAYLCAEAQVPFLVCQPTAQTFLASCNACPTPTMTTVTTPPPMSTSSGAGAIVTITSVITITECEL